jgi:hypothetical protein
VQFTMKLFSSICVLASLIVNTAHATSHVATASFTNSIRFLFDVDGNQIDAYGSKINYFNGRYYLYGNSFAITGVAFGIKSYSSVDLVNWAYEDFLYNPFSDNPCNNIGGCGRPHILYNQKSQTYVLWANAGPSGYIVATSNSPSTGFQFASSTAAIDPAFNGLQPADFAVESFGNEAYLVFSALNFKDPRAGSIWPPIFQTLHISPLTDDFMNTTLVSYNITSPSFDLVDQETESPDIFKRNGVYYVAASNTCGYCNGSIGLLYRSGSIEGPWTRQIISGYSCDGQVEGVLPLTNPANNQTSYVWHSTSVPGGPRVGFGGHIFQPLQFNPDGSAQDLNCAADAAFSVPFTLGTGTIASGMASTATDGSPAIAAYSAVCDSDQFTLFQTWTASKSGALKEVSVNIAKSVQTVPLTLMVFKFGEISDLIGPEYKYTLLGSASVNQTYLSFVFNTTSVYTNKTVSAGDRLGLSIAGVDFAPYCHVEYDVGSDSDHVLLQQGGGQNSWRGLAGNKSPIYERVGKGVKFFAVIE